eukprot:TRINITY_DN1139_c0_g3_i1.p1 TRINITY_DN1139_c0_g3~~TRINITY_DN1139_c0_g3_i1.p1  ORF type:complete len:294 (-),score=43.51 TRINITY_DN1139_c0_g3_i1:450-1199(-)
MANAAAAAAAATSPSTTPPSTPAPLPPTQTQRRGMRRASVSLPLLQLSMGLGKDEEGLDVYDSSLESPHPLAHSVSFNSSLPVVKDPRTRVVSDRQNRSQLLAYLEQLKTPLPLAPPSSPTLSHSHSPLTSSEAGRTRATSTVADERNTLMGIIRDLISKGHPKLPLKTRKHHFKSYPNCFKGSELVSCLVENQICSQTVCCAHYGSQNARSELALLPARAWEVLQGQVKFVSILSTPATAECFSISLH